ncbi:MAG: SPOCS domain-containing protein [Bacillota bacterium]
MTYEKDPFEFDGIPDFALQPAKEADEYNFHYIPRGATNRFDPAAYERVLHESARQAAEIEDEPETLEIHADEASKSLEDTIGAGFPTRMEELIPVAFDTPGDMNSGTAETAAETIEETVEEIAEIVEEIAELIEEVAEEVAEEAVTIETDDFETESAPLFSSAPIPRPVFQPVLVPKTTTSKIVPVVGSLISSKLKLVDMRQKAPLRLSIEEDILVPDVKPDLERILAMSGKIKLAEREIHTGQSETNSVRIMGDLILQTLYIPEHMVDGEPIISIESKIPFKSDMEMKAGPNSELAIASNIESIDFTVVNERKFRIRAAAVFGIREYGNVDIEVFEGLRDEEVQMLKEKISLTDVAARKTETIEVKDDLMLKENSPEILKILSYDVNIVENHKQVTKEKAVINASVYCNVMYLGADGNADISKAEETDEASGTEMVIPVLYQGKTEFTQFIRLDGDYNVNDQNPAGSKVSFNVASLKLTAKEDGSGKRNLFELDMNVDTGLELYKNIEKEVVTDVYHHKKNIQFETDDIGIMALGGSGVAEISAREIVNVPERYGSVDKVVYISGNVNEKRSFIDQTKSIVEGVVTVNLICTSADANQEVFNIVQEIPFRSAMEIPGINSDMVANNDIVLKELWFDKINNKQIEVNAGILVNTAVASQKSHQLVKNISFLESPPDNNPSPGIILYITRKGDTIWNIAKNHRTTIEEVRKINDLEYGKEIKPGTKLLIVAQNH